MAVHEAKTQQYEAELSRAGQFVDSVLIPVAERICISDELSMVDLLTPLSIVYQERTGDVFRPSTVQDTIQARMGPSKKGIVGEKTILGGILLDINIWLDTLAQASGDVRYGVLVESRLPALNDAITANKGSQSLIILAGGRARDEKRRLIIAGIGKLTLSHARVKSFMSLHGISDENALYDFLTAPTIDRT